MSTPNVSGEIVTVPRDAVLAAVEYIEYLQTQAKSLGVTFTHEGPGPRMAPLYAALSGSDAQVQS